MALRVGIAAALAVVALLLVVISQRRTSAPRDGAVLHGAREAPAQLHRSDFARPDAEWLVVVFSSAQCGGCSDMVRKANVLDSSHVAVTEVEYSAQRALHERYAIDAVPLVVIADHRGVVRRHFFGATSATDLWAAIADLRAPDAAATRPRGHCASDESDPV